ncbi:hypothetical protein FOA43_001279 [Brettanomyces nanus]|uniref:Xylanolytic transcriptional activator regulatory domain-containing protein n=1 Tax=Eeniella nana TaxID=13502 RepID=A0A875RZ85_EENNA|nr:uncharacterized protein FOA43_001279 [Brettanomyces nanus]QPG73963.1 hypothetical protein FOA43_001279 [Brettanomyces nanus]
MVDLTGTRSIGEMDTAELLDLLSKVTRTLKNRKAFPEVVEDEGTNEVLSDSNTETEDIYEDEFTLPPPPCFHGGRGPRGFPFPPPPPPPFLEMGFEGMPPPPPPPPPPFSIPGVNIFMTAPPPPPFGSHHHHGFEGFGEPQEPRGPRCPRGSRGRWGSRGPRGPPRRSRGPGGPRDPRDPRDPRGPRGPRGPKGPRDPREISKRPMGPWEPPMDYDFYSIPPPYPFEPFDGGERKFHQHRGPAEYCGRGRATGPGNSGFSGSSGGSGPNAPSGSHTDTLTTNTSSPTISALASSNPGLLAKLSDRLKLYDDILHRLLPDIKLTDLNDNPQPINPMKLMAALNKIRETNQNDSLSGSKAIAHTYDLLPEIPVPYIPTVKMPFGGTKGSPGMQGAKSIQGTQAIKPAQVTSGLDNFPFSAVSKAVALTPVGSSSCINSDDSSIGREIKIILPSREVALELIAKTWSSACVLFRFYHRPAFIEDLNELYDIDPSQYTNKQQRFLPLVYSVLACGALFFKSDEMTSGISTRKEAGPKVEDVEDEGYRYFTAARKLIDITDTRDTFGIQTIVMLIIFLQCSARLSTCYAYIGIALRAALREGLHRKLDYPFNAIELETRKRLFWTLYKMDIYVNTMLGLPRTISEDDFDQELPIELDDENITITGYRYERQGSRLSSSGIANAHTKLMLIMGHIVAKLYPVKRKSAPPKSRSFARAIQGHPGMAHDIVSELEMELQKWLDSLPMELKPGMEPPEQYLKANRLLHMSYLHVRIILYRPFIHYIAAGGRAASDIEGSTASLSKAQNCINVARVVVKLAEDMIERHLLSGSYWFSIYTIFFSVACLVYYVHYAPSLSADGNLDPNYLAVKKDAESGKKVLDQLKDSSTAARRTYNILNALFEQMNGRTAGSSHSEESFVTPRMGRWKQKESGPRESVGSPRDFPLSYSAVDAASHKLPNEQINKIINGVNFIDGVPTGINLATASLAEQGAGRNACVGPPAATSSRVKTANAAALSSSADIQSSYNSSTLPFEPATPFAPPSVVGENDPLGTSSIDSQYVPGPMDQLDMKIFGRFLPPYMLSQSVGHPQIQSIQESGTDSMQPLPAGTERDSFDANASASLMNRPQDVAAFLPYDGQQDSIFEQPTSAIPSGLSTVVQSEQQREQDQQKLQQEGDSVAFSSTASPTETPPLDSNFADFLFDDFFDNKRTRRDKQ